MQIENSVVDAFSRALASLASKRGIKYAYSALNGQDRDAGADSLVMTETSFAIIEFKSGWTNTIDERKKQKREMLCENLAINKKMKDLHDYFHFIMWRDRYNALMADIYRNIICVERVFPENNKAWCGKPAAFSALELGKGLLESHVRYKTSLEDFEKYLEFVMNLSTDGEKSTVALFMYDLSEEAISLKEFESVGDAYTWFIEKKAEPQAGLSI